jgi:hypothetical protein
MITIFVSQICFVIDTFRYSKQVISAAYRVNLRIILILASCIFVTYLVSTITRLIGQRNFFKISRKLLSIGSFVNCCEGTVFSNAVIALHVVLFVICLIRYSVHWANNQCQLDSLHFFISALVCDTVTSFAALHFLYLVFTVCRHFMLLNSILNEVVVSTVKSERILSSKVHTASDFLPEKCSVISSLRNILHHHVILCDMLDIINSTSSLQFLALIGSKFVYTTIFLYLLFFSIFDRFLFPVHTIASLIPLVSVEVIQLVAVLYCCESVSLQVCII